jgi:RNA polymerase sigma-70 factor, ECF subfamily
LTEDDLRGRMIGGLGGDAVAYRHFLDGLAGHLRAYLRRRLAQRPHEVEDLVQEALLAVHIQRHTYDPALPITAWIHAIAKYKLIDYLRRCARTDDLNDVLDEEDDLLGDIDHAAVEARHDLAKLLAQLPDRQRLPIQFVKIAGESVGDTARRTGMSESAVKVGIHRGLKALARSIRSVG